MDTIGILEKVFLSLLIPIIIAFITAKLTLTKARKDQKLSLNSNLAKKQIEAAEIVWPIFGPTSVSIGKDKIIRKESGVYKLNTKNAETFVHTMNETFSGKPGLYLPADFRHSYHAFRDYIIDKLLIHTEENVDIPTEIVQEFKAKRKELRLAVRQIIGSTNLSIINNIQRN